MPFVYRGVADLEKSSKVGGGECARLVQHYLPRVGHTSTWVPGERVIEVLQAGGKIEPGTAVAVFVNGRYPASGHRHAALYEGAVTACAYDPKLKRCPIMGVILMDQWNPKPGNPEKNRVSRRTVFRRGQMRSNGSWPSPSDNAEALYVIEHRATVKAK